MNRLDDLSGPAARVRASLAIEWPDRSVTAATSENECAEGELATAAALTLADAVCRSGYPRVLSLLARTVVSASGMGSHPDADAEIEQLNVNLVRCAEELAAAWDRFDARKSDQ